MTNDIKREIHSNAIRYWERLRLFYNAALVVVVLVNIFVAWPESTVVFSFEKIQTLFVLAVLANIAYCSAYVVDVFALYSELKPTWLGFRWVLFLIGLLFAIILTNSISEQLFKC